MSSRLTGHPTGMGTSATQDRRWLTVVALAAVVVAVLSVAGLKASGATPAETLDLTSSSVAAPPAARAAAVTPKATKTVMIMNYAYSPASLSVAVGDTVTWTNMDTAPHTVTVTSGPVQFNSGNLQKGQSYSYTFTTAGTYKYYCAVHPDMKASVTVT